jgi:hypothetical protein
MHDWNGSTMTLRAIVSQCAGTVPFGNFPRYGILPAPETLAQFAAVADALQQIGYHLDGWRGQAAIDWHVDTGAVRRIKKLGKPTSGRTMADRVDAYERALLNDARLKGFDYHHNQVKLSDLSLLATLQHFGAATRLLDFSRNIMVALWFACQEELDKTGVVIGFKVDPSHFIDQAAHVDKSIQELLDFEDGTRSYRACNIAWEPKSLYERIRSQQSLFLFGLSYEGIWSSLTPYSFQYHSILVRAPHNQSEEARRLGLFVAIAITPALKSAMIGHWDHLIGFDIPTLFPDLEGFSRYNGATNPISPKMRAAI